MKHKIDSPATPIALQYTDDWRIFHTLDKDIKKVEAAMKLSLKRGKQRAVHEDDG